MILNIVESNYGYMEKKFVSRISSSGDVGTFSHYHYDQKSTYNTNHVLWWINIHLKYNSYRVHILYQYHTNFSPIVTQTNEKRQSNKTTNIIFMFNSGVMRCMAIGNHIDYYKKITHLELYQGDIRDLK